MVREDGDKIIKISEDVEKYLKDTLLESEPVNVIYRKLIENSKKKVINSSDFSWISVGVLNNSTPNAIFSAEYNVGDDTLEQDTSENEYNDINMSDQPNNEAENTTKSINTPNTNEVSKSNNNEQNNDESADKTEDDEVDSKLFEDAAKEHSIPKEMMQGVKTMGDNFKKRSRNALVNLPSNLLHNIWNVLIDCIMKSPGMADINIFKGFTNGLIDIFDSTGYENSEDIYDYYRQHSKFAQNWQIIFDNIGKMSNSDLGKFLDSQFALAEKYANVDEIPAEVKSRLDITAALLNATFELYENRKKALMKFAEKEGIGARIDNFFSALKNNSSGVADSVALVIAAVPAYNKYIRGTTSAADNAIAKLISAIAVGIAEGDFNRRIRKTDNKTENKQNSGVPTYNELVKFLSPYNGKTTNELNFSDTDNINDHGEADIIADNNRIQISVFEYISSDKDSANGDTTANNTAENTSTSNTEEKVKYERAHSPVVYNIDNQSWDAFCTSEVKNNKNEAKELFSLINSNKIDDFVVYLFNNVDPNKFNG
jgi:hypothetical protein